MATQDRFGSEAPADVDAAAGADLHATLLRVLTDLYVHRLSHTAEEERRYSELALRLLGAADVSARAALARRFARHPSPPLQVLQWLSADVPEVAAELHGHPLLRPAAPLEPAQPVAEDEQAAPATVAGSIGVATADELNELFFAANAEERRLILLNLNVVAPDPAGAGDISRDPSISLRLEAAALGGNREAFVHDLARALNIPHEQARRIAHDELGEPVVIAAKALGMPRDVLHRLLMFVNPAVGHSVERVHALATLNDELTAAAAEGIVAIWQALQRTERGTKHQPLAWDDETRRCARPVAAGQRLPPATQTSQRRTAS